MIQLNGITFGYGGRTLMDNISLHVKPQDRIGLVGPNGTGKTTLMRLLNGELSGFSGNISKRKGIEVGLLPQDGIFDKGRTLLDSAMEAFAPLKIIKSRMEELNHALETERRDAELATLLEELGECQHEYEIRGGFTAKADACRVLTGLGFSEADFEREVSTFSGGKQMRIALTRLLLLRPDVLLLDEPTNHLDLPALIWLENFLHEYPGAIVVISHDRNFLDSVVVRIAEFSQATLVMYSGNYTYYEIEKEKREEILLGRIENQQREIRDTEKFIERFRYKATKARQVQSRIKALDKVERIEGPPKTRTLKFSFKTRKPSGRVVMRLNDVDKSYGDNEVLKKVNLTIHRGNRIAIIGANGLGKSTLMRVLAGRVEFTGERVLGHNVTISYFSQDQYELLDPEGTVLDEASKALGEDYKGNIRTLLGVFMFSGRDVEKKVRVLSGGEKSRLLLARMMADPSNFLLLDEPTNHLDPQSRAMLEKVLTGYDGTICFVSHDRYFINAVADRLFEFTGGGIDEYLGNYADYEATKKERERARLEAEALAAGEEKPAEKKPTAHADKKIARKERGAVIKEHTRALNAAKKAVAELEAEIAALETRQTGLETILADPATYNDPEKARTIPLQHKECREQLESALSRWEKKSKKLADTEKKLEEVEKQ